MKLIKLGLRGRMLNIIQSMYKSVKSRVKYANKLSSDFSCTLGVRQAGCLSRFLFAMFLNDLEEKNTLNGFDGVPVDMVKILVLLYADDMLIYSDTA